MPDGGVPMRTNYHEWSMIKSRSTSLVTGATLSLIAALVSCRLSAQTIRGSIVLTDTTIGVAGAIVVATDARGAVTRALTSDGGKFSLRLPHAGSFELGVLRIGYRPTTGPSVNLVGNETVSVRIIANSVHVSLTVVNVRAASECRVRPDSGLLVARVWEEARKAMLASQLIADLVPVTGEWIEYDRRLDSTARLVRQQRVQSVRHPTTHVFKSIPAETLATYGYVVGDSTGTAFYAPDAEALLSESFVATHCFRLADTRSAADSGQLGVRFQPVRNRRGVHDIEGTLWIDQATAELRSLEFRYTGFPDVGDALAGGGRVEFMRLRNGSWVITSWNTRLPILEARDRTGGVGAFRTVYATSNTIVRAVQVAGGEVGRIIRGDSVLLERIGASARIQLVARDPMVPVAGASVALKGTDYVGTTDAKGFIRLGPLPAGRYSASIVIPQFDSLLALPFEREVEVRDAASARTDSMLLPPARAFLTQLCRRDSLDTGTGMLRGTVRNPLGSVAPGASVTVTFMRVDARGLKTGIVKYLETSVGAIADVRGRWQVCGIPHESDLVVLAVADSGRAQRRLRLDGARLFGTVDLELLAAAPSDGVPESSRGLVEIVVATIDGVRLPDVTLEIRMVDGAQRKAVTDKSGRALLTSVAVGLMTVDARRVGLKPGKLALNIGAGRNTAPIILSRLDVPRLDTVRVMGGRRVVSRLDAFETRRLNGDATRTIGRADIEKRRPMDTWRLLADIPSVQIVPDGAGMFAASRRPAQRDPSAVCPMQILVDGVRLQLSGSKGVDLSLLPRPDEIHGIEVFAGGARMPLEYGGTGENKSCGLIAIWTGDR